MPGSKPAARWRPASSRWIWKRIRLLQILIANAGHVAGTERLLTHVWGHRGNGDRQLLKQLVRRLRQKIETDPAEPRYLQIEPGAGHRLVG